MPVTQLNQPFINNAKCPSDKKKVDHFDSKTTGLVFTILASGRKTFYIRFLDTHKRTVQKRIGDASLIKLSDIRELAIKYLGQISLGNNPFAEADDLKKVPKFSQFIEDQYLPYVKSYKRSWQCDLSLIKNHILPNFGGMYMNEITKKDLHNFISRHIKTHAPGSVNRVLILIRYMFNLAIKWEVPCITKNPTKDVNLLEENNKMERYLTVEETERLIEAIQQSQSPMLKYIVSMLILTGARKSEVLHAKWSEFNFEHRIWRIGMSKSGRARHVPMSDGLIKLLNLVPRHQNSEFLFVNPETGKRVVNFFSAWNTARTRAALADVRIHDLRHSFASFLVNSGRSLYEVQRILGHTQIKTTQRYAHLSHDSLLSASNEVGKIVPSLRPAISAIGTAKLNNARYTQYRTDRGTNSNLN